MSTRRSFLAPFTLLLISFTSQADAVPHLWSEGFGGPQYQAGRCVAVDNQGNSIVTGNFRDSIDFGGGPLAGFHWDDIFLAKFDLAGNHLWSQSFGGTGSYDRGYGVAVDDAGNIFITGQFRDTVDFGGGPLTSAGDHDIFVAKYDLDGNHLWSQRFGDSGADRGLSIAADSSGNVFVAGDFEYDVDFGGGTLTSIHFEDVFAVKFDTNGNHLWSDRYGGTGAQTPLDIAVDGAGNLLLTGEFDVSVDFGGGPLSNGGGGADIFVAKLDPNGNHLWSDGYGAGLEDAGRGVVSDAAGNVIVTGSFRNTVDFGGASLISSGGSDIFVVKFDPSGNHLWSQRFGETYNQGGQSVAVDDAGQVVITGGMHGSANFGGGMLTSAGGNDIFVAQFDASGAHLWSDRFGDSNTQSPWCVTVDGSANIFLTGVFSGAVDFGGGPLTSTGAIDVFLVKFGESLSQPMVELYDYATVNYDPSAWEIRLGLINNGPGSAHAIVGHLSEDISWLRITDSDCSYGDLPEGWLSYGGPGDSYMLRLLDDYPGGSFVIRLDVSYQDAQGTQYLLSSEISLDPSSTAVISGENTAAAVRLHPNHPNPCNPQTRISFELPRAGNADLVIYNVAGQVVRTLSSGALPAGHHSYVWTGVSKEGRPVPAGTYFYRLRTDRFNETKRMVLVR